MPTMSGRGSRTPSGKSPAASSVTRILRPRGRSQSTSRVADGPIHAADIPGHAARTDSASQAANCVKSAARPGQAAASPPARADRRTGLSRLYASGQPSRKQAEFDAGVAHVHGNHGVLPSAALPGVRRLVQRLGDGGHQAG